MASLDEIAEESAAYVIDEILEPEDRESQKLATQEFADAVGYDPGLISRAWKARTFEEYDVGVEMVGRQENRIIWRVSYSPDSDALPEYTAADPEQDEEPLQSVRERLEGYGVTVERPELLKPEYADVYAEALDQLRDGEQENDTMIGVISQHDAVQERYETLQGKIETASQRLEELREGVREVQEYRKRVGEATRVLLRLE